MRPYLSIVTTLYNSAAFLPAFYQRACQTTRSITDDFEFILVNDGSPDSSLEVARELQQQDARITVIDLSRNFGHHQAMMTGLAHARGERVFLIDCDLEVAPEVLMEFWPLLDSTESDVIYGVQQLREGRWLERAAAGLFYTVFNWLSAHPLPRNLTTARLMTRRYVEALLLHGEREIMIAGLWVITGFKQVACPVSKAVKSSSDYSWGRKVSVLVNAITSFSNRPLVLIFYLGLALCLVAGLAGTALIVRRLFFGVLLAGWPSLIVSVWFLGGLTIFCIGIIGIYLSKVFIETKQRPQAVIRGVYKQAREYQDEPRSHLESHR
jgi:putative glycosyltransferase